MSGLVTDLVGVNNGGKGKREIKDSEGPFRIFYLSFPSSPLFTPTKSAHFQGEL